MSCLHHTMAMQAATQGPASSRTVSNVDSLQMFHLVTESLPRGLYNSPNNALLLQWAWLASSVSVYRLCHISTCSAPAERAQLQVVQGMAAEPNSINAIELLTADLAQTQGNVCKTCRLLTFQSLVQPRPSAPLNSLVCLGHSQKVAIFHHAAAQAYL